MILLLIQIPVERIKVNNKTVICQKISRDFMLQVFSRLPKVCTEPNLENPNSKFHLPGFIRSYYAILASLITMSHLLRSKHGCWTCRLRKKKCDENQPRCAICESLSITCYGFGVKPDWMDGGEKERAVANSIKEIVKHTSRRKDMTQSRKRSGTAVKLAPKPVPNAVKDTTITLESMESATINNENERTEAAVSLTFLVLRQISDTNDH